MTIHTPHFSVDVYRSTHDGSNGGITSPSRGFSRFVLFVDAPSDPEIDAALEHGAAPLLLVRRYLGGEPAWYVAPLTPETRRTRDGERYAVGGMFGGAFVWTSDSRFRSNISEHPLPVHDRFETPSQYATFSR